MNEKTHNDINKIETENQSVGKVEEKSNFNLPTLDQFMDIISGETNMITSTPSGYNVYNKYNKTS